MPTLFVVVPLTWEPPQKSEGDIENYLTFADNPFAAAASADCMTVTDVDCASASVAVGSVVSNQT